MQQRWSPSSGHMGPGPAGVGDLEPGPRRRGRAASAKTGPAAPTHSGHRACKRGPGRATGHLADGGERAQRPPPRGSSADPPPTAAAGPEPRRRPLSPAARPGNMEPSAGPRTTEPAAAREAPTSHGEVRKKMAAAVAAAAAAAASYAPLTPTARAGRRAADGGGGGGRGSGEGRGEAGRGPAGGGGRVAGWREAAGLVCSRNMAGVGDAAAPGEGSRGSADGPERDGRGQAEQPGGGHGPPLAPQHTETLGFYESDRRRERRRGRAGEAGGRTALGRGVRGTLGCESGRHRHLRGRPGCGARGVAPLPRLSRLPRRLTAPRARSARPRAPRPGAFARGLQPGNFRPGPRHCPAEVLRKDPWGILTPRREQLPGLVELKTDKLEADVIISKPR